MKHFHYMTCLFVLVLVSATTGCKPDDNQGAEAADSTATGPSISFTGDFKGPLGVQLWSVRDSMNANVGETLDKIRAMGFQEVELAGTYGMPADSFRMELDRVGLDATSMHVGYEMLRDSLASVLNQARVLGAEYLGVAWIPHPQGKPFSVEMARQAAADFNTWGAAAKEQGIQFFYHVHGYEWQPAPDGTLPFDVLAAETDSNNVKFEMDVFWVTRPGQDPVALLKQYPNRWELMHIKDLKQGTPTNDHSGGAPAETEVAVGSGMINYPAVLQAAREIGLDRYYIEDETTNPFGNIPLSIQYLSAVKNVQ